MPIPEIHFQSISMDFIVGLLNIDGLQEILVVAYKFSKYVLFIAALFACLADVANELFHKHFVKYFGLLEDIISDHDT